MGLVAALHYGPALVGHQQNGLDELIVLVVQPVGDVLLQVGRHVRVALAQQSVDRVAVCRRQSHVYQHVSLPAGGDGVTFITSEWHDGGNGRELHHGVAVGVEAAVEPDEALGRALGHAVVAGDDDVDAAPQACTLQLRHQQAHVVVHLFREFFNILHIGIFQTKEMTFT